MSSIFDMPAVGRGVYYRATRVIYVQARPALMRGQQAEGPRRAHESAARDGAQETVAHAAEASCGIHRCAL